MTHEITSLYLLPMTSLRGWRMKPWQSITPNLEFDLTLGFSLLEKYPSGETHHIWKNFHTETYLFSSSRRAFTFFLQSKKVNKNLFHDFCSTRHSSSKLDSALIYRKNYADCTTRLPTNVLSMEQKELATLKQLSVLSSITTSGSQTALLMSVTQPESL